MSSLLRCFHNISTFFVQVFLEQLEQQVYRAYKDQVDLRVPSGLLGSQDRLVLRVILVHPDHQVAQEQRVHQEIQAHQATKGRLGMLDQQEIWDLRDQLEHEDLLVRQVLPGAEDRQDQQDLLALRVPLEMQGYLVQLEEPVGISSVDGCIWPLSNI